MRPLTHLAGYARKPAWQWPRDKVFLRGLFAFPERQIPQSSEAGERRGAVHAELGCRHPERVEHCNEEIGLRVVVVDRVTARLDLVSCAAGQQDGFAGGRRAAAVRGGSLVVRVAIRDLARQEDEAVVEDRAAGLLDLVQLLKEGRKQTDFPRLDLREHQAGRNVAVVV